MVKITQSVDSGGNNATRIFACMRQWTFGTTMKETMYTCLPVTKTLIYKVPSCCSFTSGCLLLPSHCLTTGGIPVVSELDVFRIRRQSTNVSMQMIVGLQWIKVTIVDGVCEYDESFDNTRGVVWTASLTHSLAVDLDPASRTALSPFCHRAQAPADYVGSTGRSITQSASGQRSSTKVRIAVSSPLAVANGFVWLWTQWVSPPNGISIASAVFCVHHSNDSVLGQTGKQPPKIAHSLSGNWTPSTKWFLASQSPNSISIGSAVLQGTSVRSTHRHRQTDRPLHHYTIKVELYHKKIIEY